MTGMPNSRAPSGDPAGRRSSHELLPHTAEVLVRLRAPDLGGLAAEAGRALAELQLGGTPPPARGAWRDVVVQAGDPGALLVDWLNELIFLAETERWVATEFEPKQGGEGELRIGARGVRVDPAPSLVKAATHHGLEVRARDDGLEAEVVLDV